MYLFSFMPCCFVPDNEEELEEFVKKLQHVIIFLLFQIKFKINFFSKKLYLCVIFIF